MLRTTSGPQQIYVERPRLRRRPHSDKWLNSGGVKGSSAIWLTDSVGVRKRYGKFESAHAEQGSWRSKFEEYTLLTGSRDEPVEDKTVVVFVSERGRATYRSAVPLLSGTYLRDDDTSALSVRCRCRCRCRRSCCCCCCFALTAVDCC